MRGGAPSAYTVSFKGFEAMSHNLANGLLTHVSVTSRNNPLFGNGSVRTFPWQRINTEKQNNIGTVRHGDLYSVRPEVILNHENPRMAALARTSSNC
jgi:hypothetical protein